MLYICVYVIYLYMYVIMCAHRTYMSASGGSRIPICIYIIYIHIYILQNIVYIHKYKYIYMSVWDIWIALRRMAFRPSPWVNKIVKVHYGVKAPEVQSLLAAP